MTAEQLLLPLRVLELVECQHSEMHHIKRSSGRPYQMRVTITQGPVYTGKRITVPLGTRNIEMAKLTRDCVLHALKAAGFLCGDISEIEESKLGS